MAGLADDFGAGVLDAPAITDLEGLNNEPDPVVAGLREIFDGLPENATRDTVRDWFMETQRKAEQAEAHRLQVEKYEGMLAERLKSEGQAPPGNPPAPTPAAEAKAEAKRRYSAVQQVDERLKPYLGGAFSEPDFNGNYVPKADYKFEPTVRQACEQMNAALNAQRAVLNDVTTNFYEAWDEGATHSKVLAELRQQIEDSKKLNEELRQQMTQQLAPVQQNMQDQAREALVRQHYALLVAEKPGGLTDWTPAGQTFLKMTESKANGGHEMDPSAAIDLIKTTMASYVPAPPPKPAKKTPLVNRLSPHLNGGASRIPELSARHPQTTSSFRTRLDDLGDAISDE